MRKMKAIPTKSYIDWLKVANGTFWILSQNFSILIHILCDKMLKTLSSVNLKKSSSFSECNSQLSPDGCKFKLSKETADLVNAICDLNNKH